MPIIQLLFAGSGVYTKTNSYTVAGAKPRVTVMPDGTFTLFPLEPTTRSVSVEMWGGGGASGSARYGASGNGGPGGYISATIPTSQIGANILRLVVGGGGGATGGGEFNPAGSNDYYARPLGQFLEFNTSTIQQIETQSVSSNPTFSTVSLRGTPTTSVSSPSYSTITPLGSTSVRNVRTYSTIQNLGSVSGADVTSLDLSTIPGLVLQANDIVLVASATDANISIPTPTDYTSILNATNAGNPSYRLSFRRITAADQTSIATTATVGTGDAQRQVTYVATVFRGVTPTGTPYITPTVANNTGDPDPPPISTSTPNFMSVIFGFLDNESVASGDISVPANYTSLVSQGTPAGAPNGATVMTASRFLPTPVSGLNPDPFNIIPNAIDELHIAVNLGLRPEETFTTVADTLTLPTGLATNDIILLASISNGGTIAPPPLAQGYSTILSSNTTNPSYQLSYKRIGATVDTQITGLDNLSSDGSDIAHIAMVFRGVIPTGVPYILSPVASGTGNPDPPDITTNTPNFMSVIFGLLGNKSIIPTNITAPTNYTGLISQAVGEGFSATAEATLMSAYRFLNATSSGLETPAAFGVTGATAADDNFAITIGLRPETTLSPIPETLLLPTGTTVDDVVLVASFSDGGTMNLPTNGSENYVSISARTTGGPSYQLSYKRITETDLLTNTISGLSLSGQTAGAPFAGEPAGVAHIAMTFSGVDNTGDPIIFSSVTGTGAVDPPAITPDISNFTSVAFGFLANIGVVDSPTITAPLGYTKIPTLSVGSDSGGTTQATLVSAYASNPTDADINPGTFGGISGIYEALTVGLRPGVSAVASATSITLTNPLQEHDIILVSSISDNGTMNIPTSPAGFVPISQGNPNCAYQLSYKRITAAEVGTTLISGLSNSGTRDDGTGVTGVAHLAMVFRGVNTSIDLATTFATANNGNGNGAPNPPSINGVGADDAVIAFGFLDDRSVVPETPYPFSNIAFQRVGTLTGQNANQGTIMVSYELNPPTGTVDPNAFAVPNNDGWVAITGRLPPQVNARFSTATGSCGGSGGGYTGIFLLDGTPLLIAGGGGGGGGATTYPLLTSRGGDGGSGGGANGLNGNILVTDGVSFKLAGGGGFGGGPSAGGAGGSTLLGLSGTPTTGNQGEAGVIYNSASVPPVGGFYSGGRGANSPYNDLIALPLQGANATGGWNRGAGGGSSRTDSFTTLVPSPTDCGGGGGAGYYGGGGGGSGDGGGGGGGGGGSNYVDPRLSVSINSTGVGILPAVTDLPPSGNYITGIGIGGASVSGSGVDVPGNPGGNGLIVLKYFV